MFWWHGKFLNISVYITGIETFAVLVITYILIRIFFSWCVVWWINNIRQHLLLNLTGIVSNYMRLLHSSPSSKLPTRQACLYANTDNRSYNQAACRLLRKCTTWFFLLTKEGWLWIVISISLSLMQSIHNEKKNCKTIKMMGQHLSKLIGLNHFF